MCSVLSSLPLVPSQGEVQSAWRTSRHQAHSGLFYASHRWAGALAEVEFHAGTCLTRCQLRRRYNTVQHTTWVLHCFYSLTLKDTPARKVPRPHGCRHPQALGARGRSFLCMTDWSNLAVHARPWGGESCVR